jgi:hypothetical protein
MLKNNETGIADQRKLHSSEGAKTTTADRILTPKPEWSPRAGGGLRHCHPAKESVDSPERAVSTCVLLT